MTIALTRRFAAVLLLAALGGGLAGGIRLQAQTTKCYFKDCLVFLNGTRICEVREVPCPEAT